MRPEIRREFTFKYEDTLMAKLIDKTITARDDVNYEGRLLAQALLKAKIETSFGFTLIVTKMTPPIDISKAT